GMTVDVLDVAHYLTQASGGDWFSNNAHKHQTFAAQQNYTPETPYTHAGEVSDGAPKATSENGPLRLLMVDDSPFFRSMLYPILTSAGYSVTVAEDAVHAIKMHDKGA